MKTLTSAAAALLFLVTILVSASCKPPPRPAPPHDIGDEARVTPAAEPGENATETRESHEAGPLINVALHKAVEASGAREGFSSVNAVDGNVDTSWSVAGGPGHWIEIDLGEDLPVHRIELVVDQTPEGETTHRVLGKGAEESQYRELVVLDGLTSYGQIIPHTPPAPWADLRFIRVETTRTPSWVAWKEIRVFSPG